MSNFFGPDLKKRNSGKNTLPYRKYGLKGMLETSLPKLKKASFEIEHLLGMISHKKSIITIFGHKHEIKNFIKKFDIFHERISNFIKKFDIFLEKNSHFIKKKNYIFHEKIS